MKQPTKGTMEPQKQHPSTPTLKRPQNRRNVFHKKSPYIQRKEKLSLEDLDQIFDSCDDEDDIIPPSPVQETQTRTAQLLRGKVLQSQSAATSNSPVQDVVLKSPFKNLASFKTSSPIETRSDPPDEMGRLSPIPFNMDEEEEPDREQQKPTDLMHTFEVESESTPIKKNLAPLMKVAPPQKGNGHVPVVSVVSLEPQNKVPEKKSNGLKETPGPSKKLVKPNKHTFEVDSPPERITLKNNPAPIKKMEAPREETGPGASKTLKESEMPVEIRRGKPNKHTFEVDSAPERITLKKNHAPLKKVEEPQQKNGDKLVSAPSQEPQRPAQENQFKIPSLLKKVAAPQQENGPPPVMAGRLEKPQNTAQEKLKETPATSKNLAALDKETGPRLKPQEPPVEKGSHGETNFYTFLQKLRETGKSKPAPPVKVCLPTRAPTPPLADDEFFILEEPPLIQLSIRKQSRPRPKQGTTSDAEVKGSADKFSKETQPEEAEQRQASGEAGTDHKIPSKERTAAEKQPKDRTSNGKEFLEMKKRGPKSKAGKDRPGKDRECIQEPDCAMQSQEPPGKEHGGQTKEQRVKSTKDARERIQEPDSVDLQSQEPPGKEHDGQTRVKSTKDARERIQEPDNYVELQSQEPPGNEHGETDVSLAEEILNPGGGRKRASKDVAAGKTKRTKKMTTCSPASSPDRSVAGKRQRKPPGEWWRSHGLDTVWTQQNAVEAQDLDAMKISQRGKVERTQKKQSEPGQKANKKKAAPTKVKKNNRTTGKTTAALSPQILNQEDQEDPQQADYLNFDPVQSDPVQSKTLVCPLGEASITTGDCLFNKQVSNVPKTIPDHVESRKITKKKAVVREVPENDVEIPAIQSQKPNSKSPKIRKAKMQRLAAFEDSVTTTPPDDRKKHPKVQARVLFPVQDQASLTSNVGECPTVEVTTADITETSAECWPSKNHGFQNGTSAFAFAKAQGFTSGPSSMIALEACDEQDTCLPSSEIHSALSATELCVFPLAPVRLQARDEENLTAWFSHCWPAIVKTAPQMKTDAFQWFSYRHRLMGVSEDLLHDNWCVGKMILGYHAQKPLWVDHIATTVYNVLTSAVSVTIDGTVSMYNPGLSFAVSSGHAHSINNLTDEPAVLTFNRLRNQNAD